MEDARGRTRDMQKNWSRGFVVGSDFYAPEGSGSARKETEEDFEGYIYGLLFLVQKCLLFALISG